MHNTQSSPVSRYLIFALIACIVVGMSFLAYRRALITSQGENNDGKQHGAVQANGSLQLIPENNQTVFLKGQDVVIFVYADSAKKPVIGYDLVFDKASTDLQLKNAESLIDGFKIFSNSEEDFISVTGVQDDLMDKEFIFSNEPVARLVFTAPQKTMPAANSDGAGVYELKFRFAQGETTDSNLVARDASDILAKAKGTTIYIGNQITLTVGKEIQLDKVTRIRLDKVIEPAKDCRDCITEANVTLTWTDAKGLTHSEKHVFSFGGFAGSMYSQLQQAGYMVSAHDVSSSSLVINYVPLL